MKYTVQNLNDKTIQTDSKMEANNLSYHTQKPYKNNVTGVEIQAYKVELGDANFSNRIARKNA